MPHKAMNTAVFRTAVSIWIAIFSVGGHGQSERDFESEFAQPRVIRSSDTGDILVVPMAQGLANPFDLAFRNNGDILVTERYTGRLRLIRDGLLLPNAVGGVPDVYSEVFRAGLMSIALHPDNDALVFLSYTKPIKVEGEIEQTVALVRATLDGEQLVNVEEIFVAKGLDRGIAAAKLLFEPDGHLLMSVGGAYMYMGLGDYAQDPSVHYGKLLRLDINGSPAANNPFLESGEFLPEVYSFGHRNQIGMDFHPVTGELWASENGPQGGDEVNIIRPGANYGWPEASYSRQYRGDWVSDRQWQNGVVQPEIIWWPSIAPAGLAFYTGDKVESWQGNLFVGAMLEGRIPGTGHVERIVFNSRGQEIRRESLLRGLGARITAVKQGPDGYLYALADEEYGAILRFELPRAQP
ncbi:MAG TPA: hypothetical protein DEF79_14080 [Gammaproteobacteria bacterium]|nr:hypothetical protein [Gammaproteobacteria bacterium]